MRLRPNEFAQGQRAADGVGIGVVLEQDVNLLSHSKSERILSTFFLFNVSSSRVAQNSSKMSGNWSWLKSESSGSLAPFLSGSESDNR